MAGLTLAIPEDIKKKMNIVIDANALFSILIKKGKSAEILINPSFKFYAPEFILEEAMKYAKEISLKLKRTEQELSEIFEIIRELIIFMPEKETGEFISEAEEICKDAKDIAYFALALKLQCSIWSNDKKLKE